jgi:hypothetical protein
MLTWLRRHGVFSTLLWAVLALAAAESVLLFYYLSSWLTLPLL